MDAMNTENRDRIWCSEESRWVYPDERDLPQRMRDAADTVEELLEMAGPWNTDPGLAAAPGSLREYADSLEEFLSRVLARGPVDV